MTLGTTIKRRPLSFLEPQGRFSLRLAFFYGASGACSGQKCFG